MSKMNRQDVRKRIHRRIRKKVSGTSQCPRLAVKYSNQHIYCQLIDDEAGNTLASASSLDKSVDGAASNKATASKVGALIAEKAKSLKLETVVFDRGGHLYHGKVAALADAAREAGLKF